MKVAACVAAVLSSAAMSVSAQSFVDLDFDQPRLPEPADSTGYLTWDQGAPGWGHPDGDSTDYLSYIGNAGYSQTYVLLQSPFGAASGPYGLGMRSGSYYEDDPQGGFVYAYISQTGALGPQVTSVNLLSSSYLFALTLDGISIDMRPVGLDPTSPTYAEDVMGYWGEWTGDVSAFAGQVVDLKVMDLQLPPNAPLLEVDQIQFLPVPEPSTEASFALGLLVLVAAWRSRSGGSTCAGHPGRRRR